MHPTISGLILWNTEFGSEGMISLADALCSESSAVNVLDIGCNAIGVDGAEALKLSLTQSTTVHTLGLAAGSLGNEGAVALAEVLEGSKSLLRVDMRQNDLGVAGLMALSLSVKMNPRLLALDLEGSSEGGNESEMETQLIQQVSTHCAANGVKGDAPAVPAAAAPIETE